MLTAVILPLLKRIGFPVLSMNGSDFAGVHEKSVQSKLFIKNLLLYFIEVLNEDRVDKNKSSHYN